MNAAVAKQEPRTVNAVKMISLDALIDSEDNPRIELENIEELAANIKAVGILQPLIVRRTSTQGKFEIIAGHRRKAAAVKAGRKEVPCIETDLGAKNLERYHLIENIQRDNLKPLEIGIGVYSAIHGGVTQKDLAETLGKSPAWVSKYNTIGNAADQSKTEEMQQLVAEKDGEKCYKIALKILNRVTWGGVSKAKADKEKQAELPLPDSIDVVLAMRQKDKGCGLIEDISDKEGDFIVSLSFKNEEEAIRFFSK